MREVGVGGERVPMVVGEMDSNVREWEEEKGGNGGREGDGREGEKEGRRQMKGDRWRKTGGGIWREGGGRQGGGEMEAGKTGRQRDGGRAIERQRKREWNREIG